MQVDRKGFTTRRLLRLLNARLTLYPEMHALVHSFDSGPEWAFAHSYPADGAHRSTAELETDINDFIKAHNENPAPYKWAKSADQIPAFAKRFCQKRMSRTLDSGDWRLPAFVR